MDKFYVLLNTEEILWLIKDRENILITAFNKKLLDEAEAETSNTEKTFDYLMDNAEIQYCVEPLNREYNNWSNIYDSTADAKGCTEDTLKNINLFFEAKRIIDDFYLKEYDSFADLTNLDDIVLTEYESDDNSILVTVDLLNNTFSISINGEKVYVEEYNSLERLINVGLDDLTFENIVEFVERIQE